MIENNDKCTLTLNDRALLKISGVKGVIGFGDDYITVDTMLGKLCAEGKNMKIVSLTKEEGEIIVTGEIDSLYFSKQKPRTSILSKFKV